ncbi:efflux RND transporter periplasmic adaptor subunit [Candidatus Uhrbacteria bacterium]|nr:efflux RND transporter periplasmic adaptor subunit [Candidatus Uhrbacteria bacterium]
MAVKKISKTKKPSSSKKMDEPELSVGIRKPKKRRWYHKKRTYVIPLLLLAGFGIYYFFFTNGKADQYETTIAERRNLQRTVELTGEIKPSARLNLAFERGGTIRAIYVDIGQEIEQGTLIAELQDDDLQFAYRQARAGLSAAQARLDLEIAGAKEQTIEKAEAAADQARADLTKAESDLINTRLTTQDAIDSAEIAVQTAKNNLDNQTTTLEQNVEDAYDDAVVALVNAIGPMNSALRQGDQIVGVDDTSTNSDYRNLLGVSSAGSLSRARDAYKTVKPIAESAEGHIRALNGSSSNTEIDSSADELLRALSLTQTFLIDVQAVLDGTITGPSLTSTELASLKTTIGSERTTVSTQYTTVQNAEQSITTAKLSRTDTIQSLEDAYETAVLNLNTAKTNAETSVRSAETAIEIRRAAVRSADAEVELLRSPPRTVDLEPLRAAVSEARVRLDQAEADLSKIQIIAPIDGTIADIMPELGEQVIANEPAVIMISNTLFDIEALIPEADVALVKTGQPATITLDAYGDDLEFEGQVVTEEPDQTLVQDAVYYKSRISIEATGFEIKPGMTANVTVLTEEVPNVIVIPARAIRTNDQEQRIVKVISNDEVVEREITVGIRGDEGRIAVLSGIEEGDTVIVSERN